MRPVLLAASFLCLALGVTVCVGELSRLQEQFAWKQMTYVARNGNGVVEPGPDFDQYNNVPFGVDRWRDKLFVMIPRRKQGVPSTLNWLSLTADSHVKNPPLKPYPNYETNTLKGDNKPAPDKLISVYRTRVDVCDRIWMLDTGSMEISKAQVQIQQPAIVIYDLKSDTRIKRYELVPTDVPGRSALVSITVDVTPDTCDDAFAYLPDIFGYGIVVYSFKQNRSWRVRHNSFFPDALGGGDFDLNGFQYQWPDGVFSVALTGPKKDGHRVALYHALASTYEFCVSTVVLKNETLATRPYHGKDFKVVGNRGPKSQSAVHSSDPKTGVVFFSEVGRNGLGCWNSNKPFSRDNYVHLAQDDNRFIYPSDVKVDSEGTLWVITSSMPVYIYGKLDPDVDNFHVYRANVTLLVDKTACSTTTTNQRPSRPFSSG